MILDAARMDGLIYKAKELNEHHACLFAGDSEAVLGHIAPWFFQLESGVTPFNEWLIENGSADNWGVIIRADVSDEVLYHHFRHFLMVSDEEGKELLFRFYDPRVLRVFLPACNVGELIEFFGPVDAYIMEDEEGTIIKFKLQNGELERHNLKVDLETYLKSPDSFEELPTETKVEPEKGEDKDERWNFDF